MEFQGRISKLLPMRSGVGARTGNEWKSLPFIFEYFEHDTDRYADSVMLETFDTKVIENMKEGMEVVCGWSHKAKEITRQDGSKTTINEMRLYKIESLKKASQPQQGANSNVMAQQPTQQSFTAPEPQNNGGNKDDDLPF